MSETDGASSEPETGEQVNEPADDAVPVADAQASGGLGSDDEIRDALPEDLNAVGYVGVYQFPDNSRRRIPGVLYLVSAAIFIAVWASKSDSSVLINDGFLWVGVLLVAVGVFSITSGWRMKLDETDALVAATKSVAFPVGHASAQLAWRGLRSRPTWRILCYSTEEPPLRRGFVLVDAIDGDIVSSLVEDNPEDWSQRTTEPAA